MLQNIYIFIGERKSKIEVLINMRCRSFKSIKIIPRIFQLLPSHFRKGSSCRKVAFKNLAKFTGKYLPQTLFLNMAISWSPATSLKTDSGAVVFLFFLLKNTSKGCFWRNRFHLCSIDDKITQILTTQLAYLAGNLDNVSNFYETQNTVFGGFLSSSQPQKNMFYKGVFRNLSHF